MGDSTAKETTVETAVDALKDKLAEAARLEHEEARREQRPVGPVAVRVTAVELRHVLAVRGYDPDAVNEAIDVGALVETFETPDSPGYLSLPAEEPNPSPGELAEQEQAMRLAADPSDDPRAQQSEEPVGEPVMATPSTDPAGVDGAGDSSVLVNANTPAADPVDPTGEPGHPDGAPQGEQPGAEG